MVYRSPRRRLTCGHHDCKSEHTPSRREHPASGIQSGEHKIRVRLIHCSSNPLQWDNRRETKWRTDMSKPAKNTICLWYDRDAEAAAQFYARTFPDSSVGAVHRAPGDFPDGKKGDALTVEFTVMGIPCIGLNGGPAFKHTEAFSFQIATADQVETDRYWNAIVGNGGEESMCGWCKDKWGVSWQITPIALTQAVFGPDRASAKRAFTAMMDMKKIDIAAIEAARRG